MNNVEHNWAGNLEYSTERLHFPETIDEVQVVVAHSQKARVLGSRHSFNSIADSPENLISVERLEPFIEIDHAKATVTVAAGIRYGELCQYLHEQGLAVHNLASLPHISIAGACATATHGSGVKNGNLATAVTAMDIVTADGELLALSREQDGDTFAGAVVGLGGLGVVVRMTLDVQPAFDMRQIVYEKLPLSRLEDHIEDIVSAAYSVSLFTDWQTDYVDKVWLKSRVLDDANMAWPAEFFDATLASEDLHPLANHSAVHCTPQMGVSGPSHERLPHFRMAFTPSSGKELQSEYFVAREHALDALMAIKPLSQQLKPVLMISEIRSIAADDFWMSPCYGQDCVAIHFTLHQDWPGVRKVLPLIEDALAPYSPRPHWGKLFTMSPEKVQTSYSRLADFRILLQQVDPAGKFQNSFLDKYIF